MLGSWVTKKIESGVEMHDKVLQLLWCKYDYLASRPDTLRTCSNPGFFACFGDDPPIFVSADNIRTDIIAGAFSFSGVPWCPEQAPGGIGEMFLDGEAGKEFALLRGHKGFVRRAMAHGVPLVPVYGKERALQRWRVEKLFGCLRERERAKGVGEGRGLPACRCAGLT